MYNKQKNNPKSVFQFFKEALPPSDQVAYEVICQGFFELKSRIAVAGIALNRVDDIFDRIKRDNPLLFYVNKIMYQYSPLWNELVVFPDYRFDRRQIDATTNAIYAKVRNLVEKCRSERSEWEKEKLIHDFLCSTVVYDDHFKDSSFECIGPLLFGRGVCEGIAKASKLLFDLVGIDSLIIHGKADQSRISVAAGDSHAWNMVQIEGEYYHLDVTFDLTVMTYNHLRYDYFNLSDVDICLDHEYIQSNIPRCNTVNDYYTRIGVIMPTQNAFCAYLEQSIKKGDNDVVIKLPRGINIDRATNELMAIAQQVLSKQNCPMKQLQVSCNPSQRIFHLHAV